MTADPVWKAVMRAQDNIERLESEIIGLRNRLAGLEKHVANEWRRRNGSLKAYAGQLHSYGDNIEELDRRLYALEEAARKGKIS